MSNEQDDQNPVEAEAASEEIEEATPPVNTDAEDSAALWERLSRPATETAPTPQPEVEEPEAKQPAAQPAEEPKAAEPSADPMLAKRFRDSQDFIKTLKGENKTLQEQLSKLASEVEELKRQPAQPPVPVKADSANSVSSAQVVSETAEEIFAGIMDQLPATVKQEVETFPELFRGIDALVRHRLAQQQPTQVQPDNWREQVDADLQDFRQQKRERYVQQKLDERHRMANEQLGISNAAHLDLDDTTFAGWVMAKPYRQKQVLDFENTEAFVDLMRSFLYEYPELSARPTGAETAPAKHAPPPPNPKRKLAPQALPTRAPQRTQVRRNLESEEDKQAFWDSLVNN